jgi:hypothetical protein
MPVSVDVHATPAESDTSVKQIPSSQWTPPNTIGSVPTHVPSEQTSVRVHAFRSSQLEPSCRCVRLHEPVAGSQVPET